MEQKVNILNAIKYFSLDFDIFPYKLCFMNRNNKCIKQFTFTDKKEATNKLSYIYKKYIEEKKDNNV